MATKEAPGLWDRMMNSVGADQAQAAPDPSKSAFTNPSAKNAQARATQYYFKNGTDRPLQDFIDDPTLK